MNAVDLQQLTHLLTTVLPGVSEPDLTYVFTNRPPDDHPLDDWTPLAIRIDPWPSDPVDVIQAFQARQLPFDIYFDLSYFPRYTRTIIEPKVEPLLEWFELVAPLP